MAQEVVDQARTGAEELGHGTKDKYNGDDVEEMTVDEFLDWYEELRRNAPRLKFLQKQLQYFNKNVYHFRIIYAKTNYLSLKAQSNPILSF